MRGKGKKKSDEKWLKDLGKNIEKIILDRGYASVYDFWINKAGDDISRATLNFIVAGKSDPKITTLKTLSSLLKIELRQMLNF